MRLYLVVLAFLAYAAACRSDVDVDNRRTSPAPDPIQHKCGVEQTSDGAKFTCTDGSTAYVSNGMDGENGIGKPGESGVDGIGTVGPSGSDGYDQVVSLIPASSDICPTGGTIFLMARDINRNGFLDIAIDDRVQSTTICNGLEGEKGEQGDTPILPPFALVQIIDPCGKKMGINNEILIRLSNGQLLASFSDNVSGTNTRFSILEPSNYVTTDGSLCYFTVNPDLTLSNEHY